MRLLYGTWNFGAGTLLVGQSYVPVNIFISNQVFGGDAGLLNTGGVYDGRRPMIQVSFGGFKVALVEPSVEGVPGDVDTTLPKIELAYTFKSDAFTAGVVAGYNSVEDDSVGGEDYVSNVIGLWGAVNLGPAYVKMNVFQAVNADNYGLWMMGDAAATVVAGDLEDTTTIGGLLVVGAKLSDAFALEAGYGQTTHENDAFASDDTTNAMYVQATIGLAPGVFIVPEIGIIDADEGTTNNDQGDQIYYGLKTQINF